MKFCGGARNSGTTPAQGGGLATERAAVTEREAQETSMKSVLLSLLAEFTIPPGSASDKSHTLTRCSGVEGVKAWVRIGMPEAKTRACASSIPAP
jgi:hypothetical protein